RVAILRLIDRGPHIGQRPVGMVHRGSDARGGKAAQSQDHKRCCANLQRGNAEVSDQFVSVRRRKQFLWLVSVHASWEPKAIRLLRLCESRATIIAYNGE